MREVAVIRLVLIFIAAYVVYRELRINLHLFTIFEMWECISNKINDPAIYEVIII